MATQINTVKRDFMLQYILNARLSGRSTDVGSQHERKQNVEAAEDLYNKTMEKCLLPETEEK